MNQYRLFLLVVISPALDTEHANILEAVKHHSGGDYVEAFKQALPPSKSASDRSEYPFTVGYLFKTDRRSDEMAFGLLSRDSYLLVEVSADYARDEHLSVARDWLRRHRTPA